MKRIQVHICSKRIGRCLLGTLCAIFTLSVAGLIIIFIGGIDNAISEPGTDMASNPWFDIRIEIVFTLLLLAVITFFGILLYNHMLIRNANKPVITSILSGEAAKHEADIVALLKSVAKPLPGKDKLNRAATAQFMRALAELSYIDANLKAQHLLPWIEQVTNLTDGENGHFQAAYNKATALDTNVQNTYP